MSGGYLTYNYLQIRRLVDEISGEIKTNHLNLSEATIERFGEALGFLKFAQVYVKRIDFLLSEDDSEETFHEQLKEDMDSLVKEYSPKK